MMRWQDTLELVVVWLLMVGAGTACMVVVIFFIEHLLKALIT